MGIIFVAGTRVWPQSSKIFQLLYQHSFVTKKIMKAFVNLLIISSSLAGPTGIPERDLMCPTECADLEQFGSILERGSRPHFPDHVHDDCDLRSDADCDCAICDGATILPMRSFDLTTLPFDESTIRPIDHSTNRPIDHSTIRPHADCDVSVLEKKCENSEEQGGLSKLWVVLAVLLGIGLLVAAVLLAKKFTPGGGYSDGKPVTSQTESSDDLEQQNQQQS